VYPQAECLSPNPITQDVPVSAETEKREKTPFSAKNGRFLAVKVLLCPADKKT
jgi:hypothetical protein